MNLLPTWTSGELLMRQSCLNTRENLPSISDSSEISLHLIQKTGGIFNKIPAGNEVAGKALKPGFGIDTEMGLGNNDESLHLDVAFDLADDGFLNSFVDFTDFHQLVDMSRVPETASIAVTEVTDEKLEFSQVNSVPNTALAAITVSGVVISASSSKRKHAKEVDDIVNVDDIGHKSSVLDHDYVTKKAKLVLPASVSDNLTSAPEHFVSLVAEMDRYRERRDKNNHASRRSRQIRKLKFKEMDEQADILIVKNEGLRRKIEELEELAKIMKATLIEKMIINEL